MDHHQIGTNRIIRKRKNRSQKNTLIIKLLLIILWGLFLLVNTWTESIERLMYLHSFGLRWVSNPDFWSFFNFYDFTLFHPEFIKVKLGHFIGFAIMDVLLFNLLRSHKWSICLAILFAFLTEFFQLYFGRDGRLYDLMIDSLGVLSIFFLVGTVKFSR